LISRIKGKTQTGDFENGVLRRIFGPKKDVLTGMWRTLHNGELYKLYSSPNIIRMINSSGMSLAGHASSVGEERRVYWVLVRKSEGKRQVEG
jgi:hypothetical protein